MKHIECSIVIQAPYQHGRCTYAAEHPWACKNSGSWAIRIVDDRDQVLEQYANICESHLIQVVMTWMVQH